MKILVTGGAGYIGSACVDALIKLGHEVVVFDDLSTGQKDKVSNEAKLIEGNLFDTKALNKVCADNSFSTVIHFAAKKAVGESEVNPSLYFETNVVGSLNILMAMEKFNIPHLIFSSTAAVYKPPLEMVSVTESMLVEPVNVYGHSKLMVEKMITEYARLGKIKKFNIFRYFNVAGDVGLLYQEARAKNIFPLLAETLTKNTTFAIYGNDYQTNDGTGVRDYIHLADLVEAHVLAISKEESGIFNLGTGSGYSVQELVDAFSEVVGKKLATKVTDRRLGDPAFLVADASLALKVLGWKPNCTLKNMIESTLLAYGALKPK